MNGGVRVSAADLLAEQGGRVGHGFAAVRTAAFSLRWRRRAAAIGVALLVLALVLGAMSLAQGTYPLALDRVVAALSGSGTRIEHYTVMELRMPRTLTGIVTGFALGLSGALTQTVTRNPIASPDILGVSAGASLGAVAVITLGGSTVAAPLGVTGAALVGGLVMAGLIVALSWRRGAEPFRLILMGIAVNAMIVAVISWLLVSARLSRAVEANVWLIGSLDGAAWPSIRPTLVAVAVLTAAALASGRVLRMLSFGVDTAAGLGVRVGSARLVLLALSVGLAAVSVAVAGPIGFVAFAAPQLARRLAGTPSPPPLCSALLGAALVTGSDLVIRVFSPVALPVGVMTTAIGGPLLIILIVRANLRRSA